MSKFLESAASRETSTEIMEAINSLANGRSDMHGTAERIWEAPTEREVLAIWETVTKNGLIESSDFFWGTAGSSWAETLGIIE
jgi:hypothetical protein